MLVTSWVAVMSSRSKKHREIIERWKIREFLLSALRATVWMDCHTHFSWKKWGVDNEWKMKRETGQGALGPSRKGGGGEQEDSRSPSCKDCTPGGGTVVAFFVSHVGSVCWGWVSVLCSLVRSIVGIVVIDILLVRAAAGCRSLSGKFDDLAAIISWFSFQVAIFLCS